MKDSYTIREVLTNIRSSLNGLAVVGPQNAQILAAACKNLETVIGVIANEEAKAHDTAENNNGDV